MAKFKVTTPNGDFEIEAPDQESAMQAMQMYASQTQQPQQQEANPQIPTAHPIGSGQYTQPQTAMDRTLRTAGNVAQGFGDLSRVAINAAVPYNEELVGAGVGLANTLTGGGSLGENIDQSIDANRALTQQAIARTPWAERQGTILGGGAQMAGFSYVPLAKTALANIGQGAAIGGILGGDTVEGDFGARLQAAVPAALFGGSFAAATPLASKAVNYGKGKLGVGKKANIVADDILAKADDYSIEDIASLSNRAVSGSKKAKRAAQVELAKAAKINPEAKAAADRLGIDLPADVISDSIEVAQAAGLARSKLGGKEAAVWKETLDDALKKSDEVMDSISSGKTVDVISDDLMGKFTTARKSLENKAKSLYANADKSVPARSTVSLTRTKQQLDDIIADMGGLDKVSNELRMLHKTVGKKDNTYKWLINEKQELFNGMQQKLNAKYSSGASKEQASDLYNALRLDRIDHARQVGGDAVADGILLADKLNIKRIALDDSIKSTFGKNELGSISTKLTSAIRQGASGNSKALNEVLDVIPKEMQQDAIGAALTNAFRSSNVGKDVFGAGNFAVFMDRIKKNKSIYSKISSVMGGEKMRVLNDLHTVSQRVTQARANIPKTGASTQDLLKLMSPENMIEKILQSTIGKSAVGGAGLAAGGQTGAAVSGGAAELILRMTGKDSINKVSALFRSPEFKNLAAAMAKNPEQAARVVKTVVKTPVYKAWSQQAGVKNPAMWLPALLSNENETE